MGLTLWINASPQRIVAFGAITVLIGRCGSRIMEEYREKMDWIDWNPAGARLVRQPEDRRGGLFTVMAAA